MILKTSPRITQISTRSLTTALGNPKKEVLSTFCFANFTNSKAPFEFKVGVDFKENKFTLFVRNSTDKAKTWRACVQVNRVISYLGDKTFTNLHGLVGENVNSTVLVNSFKLYENVTEEKEFSRLAKLINERSHLLLFNEFD